MEFLLYGSYYKVLIAFIAIPNSPKATTGGEVRCSQGQLGASCNGPVVARCSPTRIEVLERCVCVSL